MPYPLFVLYVPLYYINYFCKSALKALFSGTFIPMSSMGYIEVFHCLLSFMLCFHIHRLFLSLQPDLYPTVGLQTPGEVVEANFGQRPFVFDIEDYVKVCQSNLSDQLLIYSKKSWFAEH